MARLEYAPPSQADIIADFSADRRLAVVADPAWLGELRLRFILWTLENRGYTFYLVHDDLPNIGRHQTYEGLERLPDKPESALIICDPEVALDLLKLAYQNGCRRVWLHSGSSSPEARAKTGEYGLDALHDLSLLCYLEPVKGPYALLRWVDGKMLERADRKEIEEPGAGQEEASKAKAGQEEASKEEADREAVGKDKAVKAETEAEKNKNKKKEAPRDVDYRYIKPVKDVEPAEDTKPAKDALPARDPMPAEDTTPPKDAMPAQDAISAENPKPAKDTTPAQDGEPAEEPE